MADKQRNVQVSLRAHVQRSHIEPSAGGCRVSPGFSAEIPTSSGFSDDVASWELWKTSEI